MPAPAEPAAGTGGIAATSPPPASVPGNLWTAIDVSDLGHLEARATVSVVVSGPDPDGHTALTLAALERQTYPRSLIEVVVEGDASEVENLEGEGDGPATKAAPPGRGVEVATGEIIVVVPAGSLPERELVEAHARWHHAVSDAAVAGVTRRVEAAGLSPGEVGDAQRDGRLDALMEPRHVADEGTPALEDFLERTEGLTRRRPGLFRVAGRGSLSVRAETLRSAGGPGEVTEPVLARLDLAFRLDCLGCVFVPERAARSYGVYPEAWIAPPGGEEPAGLGDAAGGTGPDPRAASLIPVPDFRPRGTGRLFARPAMVVDLEVEEEGAADVLEAVDAVLRGRLSAVRVRVRLPDGHPGRERIAAACASDPRVEVGVPRRDQSTASPYEVTMPVGAVPEDTTLEAIHRQLGEEGLGALHVTVPPVAGRLPLRRLPLAQRLLHGPVLTAVATGPRARARRVASHTGESPEAVLARLFRQRRIDGSEVGLRRRGAPVADPTENGALAPATDLAHERAEHLRYRARAATSQARLDRQAQRFFRERLRSGHERTRAERLEARLARLDPRYWVVWKSKRVARRGVGLPKRAWARLDALRHPLYRLKLAASARISRRRS